MSIQTEGTVSLSITELDRLRKEISDLRDDKEKLLAHAMEVRVNMTVTEDKMSIKQDYSWGPMGRGKGGGPTYQSRVVNESHLLVNEDITYIHLDTVVNNIRKEEELKVIRKTGELEREILSLKNKEEKLITKNKANLTEYQDKYKESLAQHKVELEAAVKVKQDEIDKLNGVSVESEKDALITELKLQIATMKAEKGKSLLSRIFG